jgi:hypothetical protein
LQNWWQRRLLLRLLVVTLVLLLLRICLLLLMVRERILRILWMPGTETRRWLVICGPGRISARSHGFLMRALEELL